MDNNKNGFAVASFVISIVGLIIFGIPLGILAIIFGVMSFDNNLGKAGTIIGIFDIVAMILIMLIW